MSDPIPEQAWTLLGRHELAEVWVGRTLLLHGRFVWAVIEVRNHGSERVRIDVTPDEAPQLTMLTGSLTVGWLGRRFDREHREALAKLRAEHGVVAHQLAPGERWRFYSDPLEHEGLDGVKLEGWSVLGRVTLIGDGWVEVLTWEPLKMPWPPALLAVDQAPPGLCQVDSNPETLSALLHDRPEELEPTNAGVGVVTRDLEFWLWGFERQRPSS